MNGCVPVEVIACFNGAPMKMQDVITCHQVGAYIMGGAAKPEEGVERMGQRGFENRWTGACDSQVDHGRLAAPPPLRSYFEGVINKVSGARGEHGETNHFQHGSSIDDCDQV